MQRPIIFLRIQFGQQEEKPYTKNIASQKK